MAFRKRVAHAHSRRRLERLFARIDVVILAVEQRYVHVGDGIAARAVRERLAHAFFDRRNELARNDAADDLFVERYAGTAFARLETQPHVGKLPVTAGLMLVSRMNFGAAGDRFLIRNLRRRRSRFRPCICGASRSTAMRDVLFAAAQSSNSLRYVGALQTQRRIFVDDAREHLRNLRFVHAVFRLDGNGEDRVVDGHARQQNFMTVAR